MKLSLRSWPGTSFIPRDLPVTFTALELGLCHSLLHPWSSWASQEVSRGMPCSYGMEDLPSHHCAQPQELVLYVCHAYFSSKNLFEEKIGGKRYWTYSIKTKNKNSKALGGKAKLNLSPMWERISRLLFWRPILNYVSQNGWNWCQLF